MSDEELEKLCSKIIDKMMKDDRFFLHMIIQGFGRRCEKIAEEHKEVCTNCGFFTDYCVCKRPRTQGNKIRAMSDEELANENIYFVSEGALKEGFLYTGLDGVYYKTSEEVVEANLQWLKSKVKE